MKTIITKEAAVDHLTKASHMPLSIKAENDNTARITGYASKWDLPDSYGEAVQKGAFTDSLIELKKNSSRLPMLWQHRSDQPIGAWDVFKEDDIGLYVEGDISKETQQGREAVIHIRMKSVGGLSIGYYELLAESWEVALKVGVRKLYKLDLRETSVVTFPALREAKIDAIKARIARGERLTVREFETMLREKCHISRQDAEFITEFGFKAWHQRDVEADDELGELAKAVHELNSLFKS